jgi:hypothetical protein
MVMHVFKWLLVVGNKYYLIMFVFCAFSCIDQSYDSSNMANNGSNRSQGKFSSELRDLNDSCKFACHGAGYYRNFSALSLRGNYFYSFSELRQILSDYEMSSDTFLELNVDSDTAYLGHIYFSHPVNKNKIYFQCWPIEVDKYSIFDAYIVYPDFVFQHGIHINMTKQEFSSILMNFPLRDCSPLNLSDINVVCDTFCITNDSGDSCIYIFNDRKLVQITYYNPVVW